MNLGTRLTFRARVNRRTLTGTVTQIVGKRIEVLVDGTDFHCWIGLDQVLSILGS